MLTPFLLIMIDLQASQLRERLISDIPTIVIGNISSKSSIVTSYKSAPFYPYRSVKSFNNAVPMGEYAKQAAFFSAKAMQGLCSDQVKQVNATFVQVLVSVQDPRLFAHNIEQLATLLKQGCSAELVITHAINMLKSTHNCYEQQIKISPGIMSRWQFELDVENDQQELNNMSNFDLPTLFHGTACAAHDMLDALAPILFLTQIHAMN